MTSLRDDLKTTISAENLDHFRLFDARPYSPFEAGIRTEGDSWIVYLTGERAWPDYYAEFDDEAAAIADFLTRLRLLNRLLRLREKHRRESMFG